MKAITIYQPYAALITVGAKRFETRSKLTHYRGPIAIHAGMKSWKHFHRNVDREIRLKVIETLKPHVGHSHISGYFPNLAYGAIVATAELVECWKVSSKSLGDNDLTLISSGIVVPFEEKIVGNEINFGDYSKGRYAWELVNVKMLDKPIPARGQQGLWNWDYNYCSDCKRVFPIELDCGCSRAGC